MNMVTYMFNNPVGSIYYSESLFAKLVPKLQLIYLRITCDRL